MTRQREAPAKPRGARLRPTLYDVAQRAGVSVMSVSRVLNNKPGIRRMTRACIEQAMRDLNYVPNQAAQELAAIEPAHKIAFLFDTPNATALGEMVSLGFEEAARSSARLVFIRVRAGDDPLQTLATLKNLGIGGVIVSAPLCDDVRLHLILRESGLRVVAIGTANSGELSSIGIDDTGAAFELTDYLLKLGHRRIGFIAGHPRHRSSALRRAGYEAALAHHGLRPDKALQWEGRYTFGSALDAAEEALALDPRPTAIFASNDDMAAAVISVARGRGIAVPRSLTVCGFDDSEIALMMCPQLTTVRRPVEQMVNWSIGQLVQELEAERRGVDPVVRTAVLEHAIVYRESDAPPEQGEAGRLEPVGTAGSREVGERSK